MSKDKVSIAEVNTRTSNLSEIISSVISIQKEWSNHSDFMESPGFLATVFSTLELTEILNSGGRLFIAGAEGRAPVGFALATGGRAFTSQLRNQDELLMFNEIDLSNSLYLYQIAVVEKCTRMGIGTKLLMAIANSTEKMIFADYLIEPKKNEMSQHFFHKQGFSKIGLLKLGSYRSFGALVSEVVGKRIGQ